MLTQRRFLLAVLVGIAVLGSAYSARALQTEVIATTFTGQDMSVRIFMDDAGGNIAITLTINEGVGDLRGFFLNIDDFALFDGLSVLGDDVEDFAFDEDGVRILNGVNLNGDGSPCPCDLAIEIGTPGIGHDDIFTTTFVLDAEENLALDNFAGQLLGVRVTSVGAADGADLTALKENIEEQDGRNGSSKLVVRVPDPIIPIPEPSTAFLLAAGLGALHYRRRSSR